MQRPEGMIWEESDKFDPKRASFALKMASFFILGDMVPKGMIWEESDKFDPKRASFALKMASFLNRLLPSRVLRL